MVRRSMLALGRLDLLTPQPNYIDEKTMKQRGNIERTDMCEKESIDMTLQEQVVPPPPFAYHLEALKVALLLRRVRVRVRVRVRARPRRRVSAAVARPHPEAPGHRRPAEVAVVPVLRGGRRVHEAAVAALVLRLEPSRLPRRLRPPRRTPPLHLLDVLRVLDRARRRLALLLRRPRLGALLLVRQNLRFFGFFFRLRFRSQDVLPSLRLPFASLLSELFLRRDLRILRSLCELALFTIRIDLGLLVLLVVLRFSGKDVLPSLRLPFARVLSK